MRLTSYFFTDELELWSNHDGLTWELLRAIEKLMVALRDGRKFIGVLRSWDQFGKITLVDGQLQNLC